MKKKWKRITWKDEAVNRGEHPKKGTQTEVEHEALLEMEIFPLPEGIIAEKDVFIEMRDGIKLAVNVYRPQKGGKFPVIMSFGPYGKDDSPHGYSVTKFEFSVEAGLSIGKLPISEATPFEAPDPAFWVPNDYVLIHVDTRGFFKSEGEKQVHSEIETMDYCEVVEWASTQEWSSGNVGLSGVSYLAVSQWYTAAAQPPQLKAIIPWEGFSDIYRDWRFPGGIPESSFSVFITQAFMGQLTDSFIMKMLDPVTNQNMLDHNPQLKKINIPALICASWSDHGLHTRGGFEAFKRISSKDKWLYTHGREKWAQYYSDEGLELQKKFFDFFLKGVDSGMMDTPRVRLEVRESRDEYTVRYENEWPIARTDYRKLYLDAQTGALSPIEVSQEGKVSYDSMKGKVEFDITFGQDIEITGYIKLRLWVSSEGTDDMDLLVGLKKIDADGNEVYFYGTAMSAYVKGLVSRGWLRLSQRELDEKESTPWQPILKHQGEKKMKPGEIVSAEIEIFPSSTIFREMETFRLVIQGRDLVEGIPVGRLGYSHLLNKGEHSIYTGGEHDSHLLIPVIPGKS